MEKPVEWVYNLPKIITALSDGNDREVSMFDSLADRIREDDHQAVNNTERYLRWALVLVSSIVLFVGLYMGVRLLE